MNQSTILIAPSLELGRVAPTMLATVMQIARFCLEIGHFVNRVDPLRKVGGMGGGWGKFCPIVSIRSFKFRFQRVLKRMFSLIIISLLDKQF